MKKDRKFYLDQLKYYKGEKEAPFKDHDRRLLWFYESVWFFERLSTEKNLQAEYISEFASAGLMNLPKGMPIGYKAILFNAYRKQSMASLREDAKGFREFYLKYYKGAD